MRLVLVLLVIVLGLFAAFAVQNPGIVTVKYFGFSADTSILVVIVVAFGVGILVGFLPGIPSSFRRKRRIRELESELAAQRRTQPPPPSGTP